MNEPWTRTAGRGLTVGVGWVGQGRAIGGNWNNCTRTAIQIITLRHLVTCQEICCDK